jgi:hypothetical protein
MWDYILRGARKYCVSTRLVEVRERIGALTPLWVSVNIAIPPAKLAEYRALIRPFTIVYVCVHGHVVSFDCLLLDRTTI